jgi:hypothetical protein
VTGDDRARLATRLRTHAAFCVTGPSPFYGTLLDRLAADVEAGGPTWDLLGPSLDDPPESMPQLRLLGAVHALVLTGEAPDLAARYPSTGGDGDAAAAWPALAALLGTRADDLAPWLTRPPQTNEVGRAVALISGLLVVAAETGLPLRILEVGTSAGLNLRLDHFWYESGGRGFGDPSSPVRFVDAWADATPPLEVPMRVVERGGCDRDPIDPTSETGQLVLLAYVWPDQPERVALLRRALNVAARVPVPVTRADVFDWLPTQLAAATPGVATVVFHSIFALYLTTDERARLAALLAEAGARATPAAPLAWLHLEARTLRDADAALSLTTWPGGEERTLGRAAFHLGPVRWTGPTRA